MTAAPLTLLRAELARRGLDGFIIPRADEHLGEYVPECAQRLRWLTGFSGSAGLAAVLADRAAVFSDGRYVLQLAAETDPTLWERCHIIDQPPPAWLAAHAAGARIGYDPMLISEEGLARYSEAGLAMVAVADNPLDAIWTDRPASPMAPAVAHPLAFAGRASAEKREEVAAALRAKGEDAAILTDPASLAWLLNLRGTDVPYTPLALGFALLRADATVPLFMAAAKLSPGLRAGFRNDVTISDRSAMAPALDALAGQRVRVDAAGAPVWFAARLRAAGATISPGMDPCLLPKACKNATEQAGARAAHGRDAVAICRFLHWMEQAAGRQSEVSAAEHLLALRGEGAHFRGESFPAISGAGENGAIIHYHATAATDRPIRPDEMYLIDSGAQYQDGTTDVTRTVWTGPGMPPAEMQDSFTRVLKGHIAIATLVFPQGVAGPHLDGFARAALWRAGLDYDHGTGHGVGSYLSVHEGPAGLSRAARMVPLAPGMIISNEPGFYQPGRYGIRLENLLLVQAAPFDGGKPFLRFETLTFAPFDARLIDFSLLTRDECAWLDAYHAQVLARAAPALDAAARAWLTQACAPLRRPR